MGSLGLIDGANNKEDSMTYILYSSLILCEFYLIFFKNCNLIDNFIDGITQGYLCHGGTLASLQLCTAKTQISQCILSV